MWTTHESPAPSYCRTTTPFLGTNLDRPHPNQGPQLRSTHRKLFSEFERLRVTKINSSLFYICLDLLIYVYIHEEHHEPYTDHPLPERGTGAVQVSKLLTSSDETTQFYPYLLRTETQSRFDHLLLPVGDYKDRRAEVGTGQSRRTGGRTIRGPVLPPSLFDDSTTSRPTEPKSDDGTTPGTPSPGDTSGHRPPTNRYSSFTTSTRLVLYYSPLHPVLRPETPPGRHDPPCP